MPRSLHSGRQKSSQARGQETVITHAAQWAIMFRELKKYKKKHGHCNVPGRDKENPQLSAWVNRQRQTYRGTKRSGMPREKIAQLEALGFVWHPWATRWEAWLGELKAYKVRHGHCNVPWGEENSPLAAWVDGQRRYYRNNQLAPERVQRLLAIGFSLSEPPARSVLWDTKFLRLQAYKKAHGHCNVSANSGEHTRLGQWCHTQRRLFQHHTLAPDRFRRLEGLGFQWQASGHARRWEQRFGQLQSFREIHGHCNVPASLDQPLCSWVRTQRQKFRKNLLPQNLIGRLNALGFVWNAKPTNPDNALAKFRGFRSGRKSILTAAQIARARSLLKEGKSLNAVAAALKCHYTTIIRAQFSSPPKLN